MQANLNALGIILLVSSTISVLWNLFTKANNHNSIIKCLFFFFLFFVLFILIRPTLLSPEKLPKIYWLIMGISLSLILSDLNGKYISKLSIFTIIILNLTLNIHYVYLLDSEEYSSYTDYAKIKNRMNETELEGLIIFLEHQRNIHTTAYPEGWIEKSLSDIKLLRTDRIQFYFEQSDTWHTFFTGIYVIRKEPIGVWYPGGLLDFSYNKIYLKEKK